TDTGDMVAIKVLRHGIGPGNLARRFALERRILATLRHRHIAQLLDVAETEDGRPCFVLEHVAGLPITTHADLNRLDLRHRLTMVIAVADAVTHAHATLVVHRDIKPGNILVAEDGEPRLLDFGIGKVIAESAAI